MLDLNRSINFYTNCRVIRTVYAKFTRNKKEHSLRTSQQTLNAIVNLLHSLYHNVRKHGIQNTEKDDFNYGLKNRRNKSN